MKHKIYLALLFTLFILTGSIDAQIESHSDESYESPVVLSLWNGGSFPEHDVNFSVTNTWLVLNNFNFNYKKKIELGINLLADNSSGYLKYHFNFGNTLTFSPSIFFSEAIKSGGSLFEQKILFNPGVTIGIRSDNNSTGLQLSFYKLLTDENTRSSEIFFDLDARDYTYGFNFYHFISSHWMINLEILGAKTAMMSANSNTIENHMLLNFCYSKNTIVSYNFGFWTQLSNRNDYCDLLCIYFLPMIGISIDLARARKNGELKKLKKDK